MKKCEPVSIKPKEFFIPYTRSFWGHKDISVKVPMSDIIDIASSVDDDGKHCGFIAEICMK